MKYFILQLLLLFSVCVYADTKPVSDNCHTTTLAKTNEQVTFCKDDPEYSLDATIQLIFAKFVCFTVGIALVGMLTSVVIMQTVSRRKP